MSGTNTGRGRIAHRSTGRGFRQRAASAFYGMVMAFCTASIALGQTASLLPNAKQQYYSDAGVPLALGQIFYYVPTTTTKKNIWLDSAETLPAANPVQLDAAGRPSQTGQTYGDGTYRQQVVDANGVVVWDALTASPAGSGGGGGSTNVGDGAFVGHIMAWAGLVAPLNYVFAYGQPVSRSTYAQLLANVTLTSSVVCTSGSAVLAGVADTSQIKIGSPIEVSCLVGSPTVVSTTSNSVTASSNATASATVSATFFPWGNGNGTTTFNIPDLRGDVLAGRNNMGGTPSSNLTTAFFANANNPVQTPNAIGAYGGQQSKTLTVGTLPNTTFPVSVSGSATISVSGTVNVTGVDSNGVEAAGILLNSAQLGANAPLLTGPPTRGITLNSSGFNAMSGFNTISSTGTASSGGSGTAFATVQPTVTVNYVIKVLPDTGNATINNIQLGVTTIAGGGLTNQLLYDNNGVVSEVPTANNSVFVTGSSGIPAWSTTLPSGVTAPAFVVTGSFTATGLVTNADLVSPTITVNGTSCTLGSACTPSSSATTITVGTTTVSGGTTNGLLYNNGTVANTAAGVNGQVLLGATAGTPQWGTVSQDCTITNAGVLTCTKTNNVLFAASATSDTTNAANISSGTLPSGRVTGAYSGLTVFGVNSVSGLVPVTNGGSGQGTILAARGPSGFNIDEATSTGDANYTILSTDRMVYHTALTAPRTDTLPAASSVNAGQQFIVNDFRGVAGATNTVTLIRSGGDTINGVTSVVAINSQYGAGVFWSDGVSRWTFFPQTAGGGSGTVTQVVCGSGLQGGTITTTGTCTIDPVYMAPEYGGRLTLISGQPSMQTDAVGVQTVWYAPYNGGSSLTGFTGSGLTTARFTASNTDQVGISLAMAGNANWPANSSHDVLAYWTGSAWALLTRQWDAAMLPTTPQLTNVTTITTKTGATAWTTPTKAFDGTVVKNGANSASVVAGNAGLLNCIGQDFGSPQTVTSATITAPTDHFILSNQGTIDVRHYYSDDNSAYNLAALTWIADTALGASYSAPILLANQQPHRYWLTCFDNISGAGNVWLAQLQYFTTVAPVARRLTRYAGVGLVNDAALDAGVAPNVPGRTGPASTITLPQYQGIYLGSFHIDTATAGQITCNVATVGASKTCGLWNMWNQNDLVLQSTYNNVVDATMGGDQYALTSKLWGPCGASTFSLQTFVGYPRDPIELNLKRELALNTISPNAAASFETGIGFDTTTAFSSNDGSGNFDNLNTQHGFQLDGKLVLPPQSAFGLHTSTCVERANNGAGGGAVSVSVGARSQYLHARYRY